MTEDKGKYNFLTESSVCSVCGFVYEICQKPPFDKMERTDQRQSPDKLKMIRLGMIGGDSMSDAEKESFDIHYPEK